MVRRYFDLMERVADRLLGGYVSGCEKYFTLDHRKLITLLIRRYRINGNTDCIKISSTGQTVFSLVWSADGTALGNGRSLVNGGEL